MNRPMRVAMIIQSYYPRFGGAESQVAALAPRLQVRGADVYILTRRYPKMSAFERVDGLPVYRLPVPGPKALASFVFTWSSLALVRRLRPDVIHAHELFSPTTTAVAAKRLFGIPVVVTAHSTGVDGDVEKLQRKTLGRQRMKVFTSHVDMFVCINREIEHELEGIGVPAERRRLIPNGVATDHFAPVSASEIKGWRGSLGLADAPTAVFTGRLISSKRVDQLLHVWPAVRAVHPQAQLVIAGSGPEEERTRQSATEGVRLVGAVRDVAPFLKAADLFVSASTQEGMSVSFLEAMATGLPVIAVTAGGNPGLVKSGTNGWLIPPNDPGALHSVIVRLLGDPETCAAMGRAARETVVRNYDLDATAQSLYELYKQLLPRAGARPSVLSEVSG